MLSVKAKEEKNRELKAALKVSKVGDSKAPFSIPTTPKFREECYSFPWIAPFYPWSVPYNAEF